MLVEGRAIKLHPLVCTAFNADFDGDQMAVHVPLSAEAQTEARVLMLSANNLLRPQDGGPVTVPTQDMVLGSYYLTMDRMGKAEIGAENIWCEDAGDTNLTAHSIVDADDFVAANDALEKGQKKAAYRPLHFYASEEEALMVYNEHVIGPSCPIGVRSTMTVDGVSHTAVVESTPGRIIFNQNIPQDLGFVDRTDPAHVCDYEVTFTCGKKQLGQIVDRTINKHGFTVASEVLDAIKAMGYKYSTKGALTVSFSDIAVPEQKQSLIEASEKKVAAIDRKYKRGFITDTERYRLVVKEWEETTKIVTDALQEKMESDRFNPIHMMAQSGARGSINQIRQLAGMRGLMANAAGRTIEIPVKSNFREGLSVLEYFISARGARKGLADTALRTADSGYLTRRMVDVSQEVIIREEDCGAKIGIWVEDIMEGNSCIEPLAERLVGRYPVDDVIHPETGEVLQRKEDMMTEQDADRIVAAGIKKVQIRTVLQCRARKGVCAHCYGSNLAFNAECAMGEAVGVIAAQSIGEPGTQLTMRTFHSGGIAGSDITQGLPRVEELFEARKPKKVATLAEIGGVVTIEESKRTTVRTVNVVNQQTGETKSYQLASSSGIRVHDGDVIPQGFQLNEGALNPHDILRILNPRAVEDYLLKEVQKVYRQQGVDLNDKHIEVIVRQMMRKVEIDEPGDTRFLEQQVVDKMEFMEENDRIWGKKVVVDAGDSQSLQAGQIVTARKLRDENSMLKRRDLKPVEVRDAVPATSTQILQGITRAALQTSSFMSAASFQETTKVLNEAAINGKVDRLEGMKENVICGHLIPAGTGQREFEKIIVGSKEEYDRMLANKKTVLDYAVDEKVEG